MPPISEKKEQRECIFLQLEHNYRLKQEMDAHHKLVRPDSSPMPPASIMKGHAMTNG
jgi:hypothetical protein